MRHDVSSPEVSKSRSELGYDAGIALDLATLRSQHLRAVPRGQIFLGHTLLRLSYALPRRTEIVLEGAENIPGRDPVFFAMNHTDRYNYWPFQYGLWKRGLKFTATWVKGKYFESAFMSRFMIATNNIPLPSRGYVIATEFRRRHGRAPSEAEYRALRDGTGDPALLAEVDRVFRAMIDEVLRLNREALFEKSLNVLVFPQGTRSKRLSEGHVGLAQMSQHFGVPIVPVGCNGSDRLYPAGSPWSKGGRVVYRIGKPLALDGAEIGAWRVRESFTPLTAEAQPYAEKFAAITAVVMAKINELVDEEYRFAASGTSDGVKGMDRFL